jgi:hypothetical protein
VHVARTLAGVPVRLARWSVHLPGRWLRQLAGDVGTAPS